MHTEDSKEDTAIFRRATEFFEEPKEKPVRQFPAMTLTVDEMAEELHISRPTAYELVKQEGFPSFRIGQRILVNRSGLQDWIDRRCS